MEEINKKELIKRKKNSLKASGTDFTLRILAFVIAVIIWFLLSITQYPTINKPVKGVHVDFSMEGTVAQEKGLDVMNYDQIKDITVDVEIKGMNYEIGTYDINDLVATVNLDNVTKEGTYKLDIDVKSAHPTDRCSVVSVNPPTVEVDFDRMTTKTIKLTIEDSNITAADKYSLREHTAAPSEVTIEGPQQELDKIDKAVATVSESKKLDKDEKIPVSSLSLYYENGNRVNNPKVTIPDASGFSIDYVIYKQKTIDFNVDITSVPSGFDRTSLPMVLSADSITVITPKLDDKDKETKTIGSIPLSNIDLSNDFKFDVELGEGEINTTGTNSVTVSFDKTGYTTKKYDLSEEYIELLNAPEGFEVELGTLTVTVVGPEKELDELYESHISAKVDLNGIQSMGQFSKDAAISINDFDNVWVFGTPKVKVNAYPIKEDSDEEDSDSDTDSESSVNDW